MRAVFGGVAWRAGGPTRPSAAPFVRSVVRSVVRSGLVGVLSLNGRLVLDQEGGAKEGNSRKGSKSAAGPALARSALLTLDKATAVAAPTILEEAEDAVPILNEDGRPRLSGGQLLSVLCTVPRPLATHETAV